MSGTEPSVQFTGSKCLGLSISEENISNQHSCFDVNTSFVIYVNRFLCTQHRKLETISELFLTQFGQILVRTGASMY